MTNADFRKRSDADHLHVGFDEGGVASAKRRRGSLVCKSTVCACAIGLNICLFGAAQAATTLKWVGGVDNSLMTPGNWEGESISALSSTDGVVLDLTAVASGTELVSSSSTSGNLKLSGVTLAENQTVTLSGGKGFRMLSGCVFQIPSGAVLNMGMAKPNSWTDSGSTVQIKGGGQFRVTSSSFTPYLQTFDVAANSTFAWASAPEAWKGMELSVVKLSSTTARLVLEKDFRVAGVQCANGVMPEIDLNGHQLWISSGEQCCSSKFPTIVGGGEESLVFVGGGSNDFHVGSVSGVRAISLYNAQVEVADGVFDCRPDVSAYAAGVMSFAGSQTLGALGGTGISGGVKIAAGQTLTVAGGGSYPAMVMGDGSLAVDGEPLTLTGRNSYRGSTLVKSGSLTVDSAAGVANSRTRLRLTFDDSEDVLADSSADPVSMTLTGQKKAPRSVADGLGGAAARIDSADQTSCYYPNGSKVMKAFLQGKPFTVSFWMRNPTLTAQNGMRYLMINDNWNSYKFLCLYLNKNGNLGFCTGNEWGNMSKGTESQFNFLTKLPSNYLTDGRWHHVAYVYADKTMGIHVDGTNSWSKTFAQDLNIADTYLYVFGKGNEYIASGDYDEMEISDYAWSGSEIAAAAGCASRAVVDAASELPKPVAHWNFETPENLGKDVIAGHDLKNAAGGGFTGYSDARTYGGAVVVGANNVYTLKDGMPGTFPRGSASFTVSLRARIDGGSDTSRLFGWGDTTANSFFEVGLEGCPRQLSLYFGSSRATASGYMLGNERCGCASSPNSEGAWVHLVFTYDAAAGRLVGYRDGTNVLDKQTMIALGESGFYVGASVAGDKSASGRVDDVQVFDTALSDGQVKVLTRSLETGRVGPVLPAQSPIEIAAGAKLRVKGDNHVFQSLSGTGEVEVAAGSSFLLETGDAFAGTVGGLGTVKLAPGAALRNAVVSARVEIQDGATFNVADGPLVNTTADLFLPANLTVSGESLEPGAAYVLARGAKSVRLPQNLSGWSVSGLLPSQYRFSASDGEFSLKLKSGMMILVK